MNWVENAVFGIMAVIGFIVLLALILTLPTYFLWNWLMPILFGITNITLFQALGINILCGILFRSGGSSKK